jgi:hypothetical protein
MRIVSIVVLLISGLLYNGPRVAGADHSVVNGTWVTLIERSRYPRNMSPLLANVTITQSRSEMKELVMKPLADEPIQLVYSLDGRERLMRVGEDELRTSAQWQGNILVLSWKVTSRLGTVTSLKRDLTVASDGETLVMALFANGRKEDPEEIIVMRKMHPSSPLGRNTQPSSSETFSAIPTVSQR